MYARKVKGKALTLSVSGMLWNRSLVILDAETKSLWSHILGRAMRGPLEGETLEVLPGLGEPKYPPINAEEFHTLITSKYYGDDYASAKPADK